MQGAIDTNVNIKCKNNNFENSLNKQFIYKY